jgi:hypothetical protein
LLSALPIELFLKVYLYLENAGINDPEGTEKYTSTVLKYGQHFTVATEHLTCPVVKYKNPEEGLPWEGLIKAKLHKSVISYNYLISYTSTIFPYIHEMQKVK